MAEETFHEYTVDRTISRGTAENISIEFMPQSCYILNDVMSEVWQDFKADFRQKTTWDAEGHVQIRISEDAREQILAMVRDTMYRHMREEIKEYVTYRFRAAFMAFIRGRFPKPSDFNYKVKGQS
jgi:hypothetical protein